MTGPARSGTGGRRADVLMVDACLRHGTGGSPTAVVPDGDGLDDADLARIPVRAGTSHVAVLYPPAVPGGGHVLRFFTATGELPACGHGTVAAIAVLASRHAGRDGFRCLLRVAGREFEATATATATATAGAEPGGAVEAWFDQGIVVHRDATDDERAAFLPALGLDRHALHPDATIAVASPGRERLMIPVADPAVLAALRPDHERLSSASHHFGQLGCFVYVPPSAGQAAPARMFAPAIGVPEDVANANSSGCPAALLLHAGRDPSVAVDQGDALGRPSTVYATAAHTTQGTATKVGGTARLLPCVAPQNPPQPT